MVRKLGPHVIEITNNALQFASQAPTVLQIDGTAALQQARPGATTIFRHFFPVQNIYQSGRDAAAEVLVALGGYRPSYVVGFNEIAQRLGNGLERYVEWHWEFTDLMHANGQPVAGFSFSTGNPEADDWRYLQSQGFGGCDAIAKHEYWGNQGFSTWNALRYRRAHDWMGGNHPPFIITECGRDAVEGSSAGWKISGVSAAQYVQELIAYDGEISLDPYVLGATVFTAGAPAGDWVNFDVDGIYQDILGFYVPGVEPGRGRLPLVPILLFGLAGLLSTYAIATAYVQATEER